jgi:hypothetical protein
LRKVLSFDAAKDLCWTFEGQHPAFGVPSGQYVRNVHVDPFPAYPHSREEVWLQLERAASAFPIPQDVTVCILDREPMERTNGWCNCEYHWSGKEETPRKWSANIVLAGKRIPPHPAMTRYLVSHEYGHAVRQYISWKRDEKDGSNHLYDEYQKLRGFTSAKHYGGGTWHARVEELFANDFRILVVGAEVEFWPHPGFTRPEGIPAIIEFWKKEKEAAIASAAELALAT